MKRAHRYLDAHNLVNELIYNVGRLNDLVYSSRGFGVDPTCS